MHDIETLFNRSTLHQFFMQLFLKIRVANPLLPTRRPTTNSLTVVQHCLASLSELKTLWLLIQFQFIIVLNLVLIMNRILNRLIRPGGNILQIPYHHRVTANAASATAQITAGQNARMATFLGLFSQLGIQVVVVVVSLLGQLILVNIVLGGYLVLRVRLAIVFVATK